MSQYTEVIAIIMEINRMISQQGQQIEATQRQTSELMDLVHEGIDGSPSKHVSDVKQGIDQVREAFKKALSALGEAQAAVARVAG
ncbi:MAG: hypothetical protein LBG81_05135 [Coriobacteriaceae bacterium]|jgi:ubiquitin C-terminal hydrolase|nr:hypothetical protein [Coriobacteriaceae bacterium]